MSIYQPNPISESFLITEDLKIEHELEAIQSRISAIELDTNPSETTNTNFPSSPVRSGTPRCQLNEQAIRERVST